MSNKIYYKLPVWNGVKKEKIKQKISVLEIVESNIDGIYMQKSKRVINYKDEYTHMTPLKGSKYIRGLRNKKMQLLKGRFKKHHTVLEIGGGDSNIQKYINFKHLTLVDPSIKNKIKTKKNIEVYDDFFENLNLKKKYDHIILFSVIEHIENLESFFKKIMRNIKYDGFIYITTPIIDNQFCRGDFNSLLHEHTYYFTNFGLINLFNKFCLKVIKFKISNDCGYFTLKRKLKFKNNNNFIRYDFCDFIKIFQHQLIRFKKYTSNKNNLVFYGATNGLNNLIFLSKIDKYNSNYSIIDGDITKVGKYLPSSPKKIQHKKNLKKFKNICISAQSFKDEIVFENFNITSTHFK